MRLIIAILVLASSLLPTTGFAQAFPDIDALPNGVGKSAISLVVLLTVLSLAPALAIMVTCFPFVITVLSILRQSIGLQQSPPNMLIVSLAMFLTWFVMQPVLDDFWRVAGLPLWSGEISIEDALRVGIPPFRTFMEMRVDPETLSRFAEISPHPEMSPDRLSVLIPAFMVSEIQRAFEIGFLVALPFLIIDLVVSAVLMSMGMMMLPPAIVALPFKLAFFAVVDGWTLISTALVRGYQ